MKVSDFDYDLPDDLIAKHPPKVRGQSRLLVLDRESGEVGVVIINRNRKVIGQSFQHGWRARCTTGMQQ